MDAFVYTRLCSHEGGGGMTDSSRASAQMTDRVWDRNRKSTHRTPESRRSRRASTHELSQTLEVEGVSAGELLATGGRGKTDGAVLAGGLCQGGEKLIETRMRAEEGLHQHALGMQLYACVANILE
jgi:hypothetical protein